MEMSEIAKRLEWLDDERRKDKNTIATLEERLALLEGNIPTFTQQVKEVSGEMARLTVLLNRFDQVDATVAQIRVDFSRSIEAIEKQRNDHDREMEKVRRGDLEGINKSIGDLRKNNDIFPELKKGIQARTEEDFRLSKLIDEVRKGLDESVRADEEYHRAQRMLEEARRQDNKRIADLQGEAAALRKRTDEQRGKIDLASESVRKMEMRISELLALESERRQAQVSFIEKQNLLQVDRDRIWKEWEDRFNAITQKSANLDVQIQAMDVTSRSMKRSQDALEEVTQRFERRINEITEMQRLTEERFRQEWINFRSDDQKRWTNYSLAQDEQHRETARFADKQSQRLVLLEDGIQELRDQILQINEDLEKRLQGLLALSHQFMDEYNRHFGKGKQTGA